MMLNFFNNVLQSSRTLLKNRRITFIAILGLTLGIGLTTTMFSIVNGTVMRGLPFAESNRIMYLLSHDAGGIGELSVTPHDYSDWRARQKSFTALAAFTRETFNLSGPGGPPERYEGSLISTNLFGLLGVKPLLGRDFSEPDGRSGAEHVVMLSYPLWKNRFGRDPHIIGQMVRVNSEPVRVIGVMPKGFAFPLFQSAWMLLHLDPLPAKRGDGPGLEVIGRLKEGVSRRQAQAEIEGISSQIELANPETNKGIRPIIRPYITEMLSEQAVALLYTMLGAAFGVLVIACANVANLLLARASLRSREVAIRSSLGAGRRQMISQFMAESFVLAVLGGLAGLLLAQFAIHLFNQSLTGLNVPFWVHVDMDLPAVVVVFGLMLLASVLSGSIPAFQASGADLNSLLKDQTRGTSGLRIGKLSRALVVLEVALSCGLLVASGLMIKSIVNLKSFDFGFLTKEVLSAEVTLPERDYPDDASRVRFFDELVRRVGARPGVAGVALTSALPAVGAGSSYFAFEGQAYPRVSDYPDSGLVVITPRFFDTFNVRLREGRPFSGADDQTAVPVVIVNQSFAKRFAAVKNLLGQRIRLGRADSKEAWKTIVGIVPDMLVGPIRSADQAGIYVPFAQRPRAQMDIVVHASSNPLGLASVIRDEVTMLDRNLPVYAIKPMDQILKDNTWFYSVFGNLFMAFGLMALILASIGLYGVMAFSVSNRTQEIGTRMALGATPQSVLSLVLRQGMGQFIIGLILGLGFALALSRLLQFVLFGVKPWDVGVFILVILVLAATGVLACLVPARAALRVDPVIALKG
jgi:predicted permease